MRPRLLLLLAAVSLSLCWARAEPKNVFRETDRSYKYDIPSPSKPGANSNCTGKCVHVFMGLLCDFVDDNADCGEQFLRCCVGGIFSRGFTRKSGTLVDMMGDGPPEQEKPTDTTTSSPSNDEHPVADAPPTKEPGPTQSTSPDKASTERETLTAMESHQSHQIESPLPKPIESDESTPCPGSCVMPLLGLLCGAISHNHSCSEGRVCCTTSSSHSEDRVETTTVNPVLEPTPRTPVTQSACHGRCIPMYLSNTCKRPSVILISKSVSCSSGMICCSSGRGANDKYDAKTEVEQVDNEDSSSGGPRTGASTEISKRLQPPHDEHRPRRRPPPSSSRRPIPIPLHRPRPHNYHKPTRPLQKPLPKPSQIKLPEDPENNSYNYYSSANEEDYSSQERLQTRRPPYYSHIRHPSLGPPVLPTPPYHEDDGVSDLTPKYYQKQGVDYTLGRPQNVGVSNLSATAALLKRPPPSSLRRPPSLTQAPPGAAVGEVFPVRVPLPASDYDDEHRSWLQSVHEQAKQRAPPKPQGQGYSQHGGNKKRKPNWQHSIKPHESEFGTPWAVPIREGDQDIPHFSASTSNSGWIPFHQAYQPVNKQKVAENHHNSSKFTPMKGVFQIPEQVSRDPNTCGVRGVQKRTNHPQNQGGTEARPGEWCWHAAIVDRKNQYMCNGALISSQWVLTAADCVLNHTNATENIYVRLGYTDIVSPYNPPGAQTKTVAKAYVHHSFDKNTLANNIALLKLEDIVELNGAVCVVCLPHKHNVAMEQRREKEDCVVTGYGTSTREDDLAYNYPRLKEASVAVLRYSDGCRGSEPRARQIELTMDVAGSFFCAGYGDVEEECTGDPGRLLVCSNGGYFELSGIASQGLSCGGPDSLTLYTNVSSYSGWINQIANVNRF